MIDLPTFLKESDADMRRGDLNGGMTYTPDPMATTKSAVAEYMEGFGWNGVGRREVTEAVQRDARGVHRALDALVDDGLVRVTEQLTRGPKASRRKVYHSMVRDRPLIEHLHVAPDGAILSEHADYRSRHGIYNRPSNHRMFDVHDL